MTGQKSAYYTMSAEAICETVNSSCHSVEVHKVDDLSFLVFPHVYPSHSFRTTSFVLSSLKELFLEKTVCDMGCGPGVVGLFALLNKAKYVVQGDINSHAVENAKENNLIKGYSDSQIITVETDCFDKIPAQKFDLIVFNMPYHCDDIEITDPIKYAFYDPNFSTIKKFLSQAKKYSHKNTEIFIAFSNKGNITWLEEIFEHSEFFWELWKITNTDQEFDNRLYKLRTVLTKQ